ncbi:helix-turn-helix domain-containing protein [Mycobacterium lentiflavum]|uniref:helix-turn-helix domain-containing protein n=1 Tax=Mycobacterium lentiflavum TaxID=141349 RepID=UPI0011125B65|nr:helix-turn-helix domain-containing protein [Mycobacterium lentiflavum]
MSHLVRRVDAIELAADVGRLVVHWLGDYAEIKRQRYGCTPEGVVAVQHALAAAIVSDGDSRQHEAEGLGLTGVLLSAYVDTAVAAQRLGLTADAVRWHCRRGNLASRRVGRQLMVSTESISDFKSRRTA